MDNKPSADTKNQASAAPKPESLKPQGDSSSQVNAPAPPTVTPSKGPGVKFHPRTYRPSHKATFISLAVVIVILGVNATIIDLVLKKQAKENQPPTTSQVTISPSVLNKIGVNSSNLGSSGVVLNVGPNADFDGKVTIGGDVSIGGQLKLNSTFTATDANLTQLQAGNTALSQLDVNGNTTTSNLSLRNNLLVTGSSQLDGVVTVNSLMTVNSGLTVTGNLAVGGVLSVNTFSANNLTSTSTLTVEGHIITGGGQPTVSAGGTALGSNGTVGINGDDSAGAISVNIGVNAANPGSSSGLIAKVTFNTAYSNTPRVVITPDGDAGIFYVTGLTNKGFSVNFNGGSTGTSGALPIGGFIIDYIVDQ